MVYLYTLIVNNALFYVYIFILIDIQFAIQRHTNTKKNPNIKVDHSIKKEKENNSYKYMAEKKTIKEH